MSRSSPPRVSLRDAEASLESDPGVVPLPTTVTEALVAGIELGRGKLLPGAGSTAELFETLATLAAHDLGAARTIEPHLDAIAIMDQCGGVDMPGGTDGLSWGVFAAEGGDAPLLYADGLLSGVKPWCSLAARLDRALVTARNADGSRQLFAVNLGHRGVHVQASGWHARGLTEIPSGPVRFDAVPATAVGAPGWYLDRPGFAWGGMAVAACWYGGSLGVARTVFEPPAGTAVLWAWPARSLLRHSAERPIRSRPCISAPSTRLSPRHAAPSSRPRHSLMPVPRPELPGPS